MSKIAQGILLFSFICSIYAGTLPSTIDPARYPNKFTFTDNTAVTLYWLIEADEIEVGLECAVTGWCAWGISRGTGMLNSDVYVGWVTDGVVMASDYTIGSSRSYGCTDGVCFDDQIGGKNDLLDFNGNEAGGKVQLLFRRKLVTGDSLDVAIVDDTLTAIYAFNPTDDGPDLPIHVTLPKPSPVGLNFITGGVSKKIDLRIVHGALMFIAWYGIAPFGFFLARFMKGFSWWFQVHRAIMFIAMLTMLAGFGVIVAYASEHFNQEHKIIGLIVVIMGFAQPIIGFLADKFFDPNRSGTPIFPDKVHWVLGWVSITLGMINIILGLILFGTAGRGLIIAYCVIAGATFAFCVGFAIFRIIKPADDGHGGGGGDH